MFGFLINQILINNFFIRSPFVYRHQIVSSIIEFIMLILGSGFFLFPGTLKLEKISKSKNEIGWILIIIGIFLNPTILGYLSGKNLGYQGFIVLLIFVFDITFVIIGCIFLLRPDIKILEIIFSRKKEILLLVFVLIATDFSLSFVIPRTYKIQCSYGWCPKQGKANRDVQDTPYIMRKVTGNYFQNGFKRWGDLSSGKKKILIIGDSFTQDIFVNNGEEWYASLEKAYPNVEFFVYGSGGYGSLQEYMVLNDYIDKINPDVILWQFCVNDYENNYYPRDSLAYGRNNLAVRPYLENGKIVYRLPLIFPLLRQYSAIGDKLLAIYDSNFKTLAQKDATLVNYGNPKEIIDQSVLATEEIMKKVAQRIGSRKAYMFETGGAIGEKEKNLCKISNMICIEGVSEDVEKQNTKDNPVHPVGDFHWNLRGNILAGQVLLDYFQKNGVLQ